MLDASAAIAVLGNHPASGPLRLELTRSRGAVHAPELILLEVANVIGRAVRRKELTKDQARSGLLDLDDLVSERWSHRPLLPRVWGLRHNLSAYDAAYLALAELLGATLVTLDRGLATVATRTVQVVPGSESQQRG